jgi:hypothetical protein
MGGIESDLRRTVALADPVVALRRLHTHLLPQAQALRAAVIAARARAAVAANDAGWSYDQLAGELGVSKSLIQQLVAAGRRENG